MEKEKLLELDNVSVGYNSKPIISGISFVINRGQTIGVSGPNGGGKSTLLKTILGLIPPVSGTINSPFDLNFGYLPQNNPYDPIFPVSVFEFVKMGRYSRVPSGRRLKGRDISAIEEAMEKTGTTNMKDRVFRSLSGGEKQRVLLAKAICGEPDILILDEPTTSLDEKGENEFMHMIRGIIKNRGLSLIMINHHPVLTHSEHDFIVFVDRARGYFRIVKGEEINTMTRGGTYEQLS